MPIGSAAINKISYKVIEQPEIISACSEEFTISSSFISDSEEKTRWAPLRNNMMLPLNPNVPTTQGLFRDPGGMGYAPINRRDENAILISSDQSQIIDTSNEAIFKMDEGLEELLESTGAVLSSEPMLYDDDQQNKSIESTDFEYLNEMISTCISPQDTDVQRNLICSSSVSPDIISDRFAGQKGDGSTVCLQQNTVDIAFAYQNVKNEIKGEMLIKEQNNFSNLPDEENESLNTDDILSLLEDINNDFMDSNVHSNHVQLNANSDLIKTNLPSITIQRECDLQYNSKELGFPNKLDPHVEDLSVDNFNLFNKMMAEGSEGNVLEEAIANECGDLEMTEKINSFLNFSNEPKVNEEASVSPPLDDPVNSSFNPPLHIPVNHPPRVTPVNISHFAPVNPSHIAPINSIPTDPHSILRAFESTTGLKGHILNSKFIKVAVPTQSVINGVPLGDCVEKIYIISDLPVLTPLAKTTSQSDSVNESGKVPVAMTVQSNRSPELIEAATPSCSGISPKRRRSNPTRKHKIPTRAENICLDSTDDDEDEQVNTSRRRKRAKSSLDSLTDAQKYQRMREQNNRASKKCRQKKKLQMIKLEEDLKSEKKSNTQRTIMVEDLSRQLELLKMLFKKYCPKQVP